MKGYKAFYFDLTCRPSGRRIAHYEVGKEYEMDGAPVICNRGFHFCLDPIGVYNWYPERFDIRICEIESLGAFDRDSDRSKFCTDHIRIVRELSPEEIAGYPLNWLISEGVFNCISASLDAFRKAPRLYPLWTGRYDKRHFPTKKELIALEERAEEWTRVLEKHWKRKNEKENTQQ